MNRSSNRASTTRRQALAMMGACGAAPLVLGPLEVLIGGLVDGLIQKAEAASLPSGSAPRNYIYVNFEGGPARWGFDMPLRPYANSGDVIRNAHVNTRFSAAGTNAGAPEYATTSLTRNGATVQMPSLWSCLLPTAAGGTVPMANLLDHMLMIRGVNLLVDGHPSNNAKQIRPISSGPSLNGAVADRGNTSIPSVVVGSSVGAGSAYKSEKGVGAVTTSLAEPNPLAAILSPFDRGKDPLSPSYLSRRDAMEMAMKRALQALGKHAEAAGPGAKELFSLQSTAEKQIKAGIGDAVTEYPALLAKYQRLIRACATATIPGITDKPVLRSGLPVSPSGVILPAKVQSGASYYFVRNADLRTLIQQDSTVKNLAEGFAIAEYLIKRGYSNTVLMSCDSVTRLRFDDYRSVDAPGTSLGNIQNGEWNLDEHEGGSVASLIINSFMFQSLSACLYELIGVLKANQLFDESVIQVGSEFSRMPRDDLGGSDHGWMANCTSVFSGAIRSPCVVGNIALEPKLESRPETQPFTYSGTWGAAAKVRVDGAEQELTIGHSTSTIAHLLRVKPLLSNNHSLVIESSNGGIAPTIELAANKDEG